MPSVIVHEVTNLWIQTSNRSRSTICSCWNSSIAFGVFGISLNCLYVTKHMYSKHVECCFAYKVPYSTHRTLHNVTANLTIVVLLCLKWNTSFSVIFHLCFNLERRVVVYGHDEGTYFEELFHTLLSWWHDQHNFVRFESVWMNLLHEKGIRIVAKVLRDSG